MLNEEVNSASASVVVAQLLYLESQDPTKDISLYINSPGGSVTDGFAIFDTMNYIKCDVSTICMGMDVNGLKGMYKEEAEKRVKLRLALETVAKKENIEVTDADLDEEYQKMADAYKMEIDKVKAAVPADSLTEDVKVEKALKLVKDKAVIK